LGLGYLAGSLETHDVER